MDNLKIMFVCEVCAECSPETCGHYDATSLAVMPDGTWLCEECYDAACFDGDYGLPHQDADSTPSFSKLPTPSLLMIDKGERVSMGSGQAKKHAIDIVQNVAELSPEDHPKMLVIAPEDLAKIITTELLR